MNVKGKGQRLIPEELLKYLEAYKEAHPDPTAGGGATLDDIVDSQGNKRFIEGEGSSSLEGITIKYNKWSLSGTHLMLVLSFVTTGAITSYSILATYNLPDYILNKIVAVAFNDLVCEKNETSMDANIELRKFQLKKQNNEIKMVTFSSISAGREFRVQMDLLIDSE